uniref:HECT-type E3 ubiquitin transferase n=1 Tax=Trichobilharzia regenti TaxID=157069 RepID=A0AA85JQH3_TRIRE|nr:unnamed protein product [Trichobilharzia regenti]
MYSFEGNYKTKRSLVLDHTTKLSAEAIVQKTREERRLRESLHRQENAAVKIQGFLRGYIVRQKARNYCLQLFNELASRLDTTKNQSASLIGHEYEVTLLHLLQSFNMCCRKNIETEQLFTVCRLLLSKDGRDAQINWLINATSVDSIFTLSNSLLMIITYLSALPPLTKSADYALPLRVLEEVFTTPLESSSKICLNPQQLCFNLAWICRYLAKKHYFKKLAFFIDQQLQSTDGYLQDLSTQSRVFDPVEFSKPQRSRAFINLLIAPLQCASHLSKVSNSVIGLYKELVVAALNDILISYPDNDQYTISERIVRGVGIELFKLPGLHQIVISECLTAVENKSQSTAEDNPSISLVPSINLLHLLLTVVVPGMLITSEATSATSGGANSSTDIPILNQETNDCEVEDAGEESLPVLMNTGTHSHPVWSGSPTEAAVTIRCLAWMLMHSLSEPYLPIIRPVTNPKPLQLVVGKEDDLSEDEDDSDEVRPEENGQSGKTTDDRSGNSGSMSFRPAWASQLTEICIALSQHLSPLAASALSTLRNFNSDLNSPSELELIRCSAQLHYCLSQVYGLPRTSLIRINSIYSQHTVYLRSLWKLIENTKVSTTVSQYSSSACTFLTVLSSGELPSRLAELQSYLPLIFTFSDCLHHRLLCLTDTEICDNLPLEANHELTSGLSRSGCGFRAEELLHVGARLRDLMLGLIDLAYPDQLPKMTRQNLQTDSYSMDSSEQPDYAAVIRRIQQRAEVAALGSSPGAANLLLRNHTGWSVTDLRLLLYCWSSLFRRVQLLVCQIYDWDRRCRRQQDISLPAYLLQTTSPPTQSKNTLTTPNSPVSTDSIAGLHLTRPRIPLGTPSLSQTFWLKDNQGDLLNSISSQSWLVNRGDQTTLTLAGAPFGYYSILNPDRNQAELGSFALCNREIRQVLLLKEVPFVIPFEKRVKLFQVLVNSNANQNHLDRMYNSFNQPEVFIVVRRTHLYEDAFEKLSKENEPDLRPRLKVRFLNQIGLAEVGIDGGGLSREFLTEIIRAGFDPIRGFFVYASDKTLYPNPQAAAITPDYLKHYYFLGRILAKAIYEGMLVELQFAYFFLAKVISRNGGGVGFDYLYSLDPQLYKQLLFLKNYQGNVRDLSLDFTVVHSIFGQSETVELKPGGKYIPVTEANRVEYVHSVANYKLNKMIYPHVKAFTLGLNDVIPIHWLRLFDAEELQTLISGADMVIDVNDLKENTVYIGNSSTYSETLDSFWSVLQNFSEADKRSFLRFVTACSRPPMFGFRELQPPFSIQVTEEVERLPTASTCMNLLRLPDFRNAETLRDRLLYALNANAGFEYS